jgi:shikimate kinase
MRPGTPIVLIGFMATGKTTVGQLVARELQRQFRDLDHLIEERAEQKIPDLFRTRGEEVFRRLEAEALQAALKQDGIVLATGGGAACREENLQAMLGSSYVVALSAPPAEVLKRTGGASGRPLLDGAADPMGEVERLLNAREPFYARAHLRIDTVGKSAADVAAEIVAAVRQEGRS